LEGVAIINTFRGITEGRGGPETLRKEARK
jgi:hypothetical protein